MQEQRLPQTEGRVASAEIKSQTKEVNMMARKRRGRSEGSIYFRETDKQWVGSISLGYDGTGKRKRRVVYGATKQEVAEKLRQLQLKAISGTLSDVSRLTVGDYLQRWLDNTAKNKVRATTLERYEVLVRLHLKPNLGGVQLGRLGAIHVEDCYAQMERDGDGAWTRRMAGTLLSNALRHAVRLKLIAFNPAADVVKARPRDKEMLFLTEPQTRAFLAAAESRRLFALFALAIGGGLRQGELLGLQWPDIDFERGALTVARTLGTVANQFVVKEPKSKHSRRTIKLPIFTLNALQEHRHAMLKEGNIAAPVFCTKSGQYITKSNLTRQVFKPILKSANEAARARSIEQGTQAAVLPVIRFHDLRHTHATMLLSKGYSIKAVSHRLGHASIEITLKNYSHVLPEDDKALADGLDKMFG
jgi:integrase